MWIIITIASLLVISIILSIHFHRYLILIITLIIISIFLFVELKVKKTHRLREMALHTIDSFNKHGVEYWVDYGTLLGIIREGDIIKHDNDVDLCVINSKDNHDRIYKSFEYMYRKYPDKYKFTVNGWGAYRVHTLFDKLIPTLLTDVYITKKTNNMYVDPTGKVPCELVGNCKMIPWKGIMVRAPEKSHEVLVWRYGEDYMTPKKGKKGKAIDR